LKRLEFVQRITPSFDIADSVLYDEYVCIKQYVNPEKLTGWRSARISTDWCWVEIISHFSINDVPYSNVLKLVSFFFVCQELMHQQSECSS
jgi:hypothetical protein